MKHILIIGGTGMLRQASEYFIEQGNIVTLMARNEQRLQAIKQKYPEKKGKILTLEQDYRHTGQAVERVKKAVDMHMHIDVAVLWVHTAGRSFSDTIKEFLFSHHPQTKVWQLWGSSTVNPKELSQKEWKDLYPQRYREIFLGYKKHRHSIRWLTDKEISDGTIRAVEQDKVRYTVGVVDPWIAH